VTVTSTIVSVAVVAAGAAVTLAPAARAEPRPEPVPLYGFYDDYVDHSRQTFNGRPATSDPATFLGEFTTHCDMNGCVVRWLRDTTIVQNPTAPALFEYTWNNDRWESSGEYPFYCDAGGTVNAHRSEFVVPGPDGRFFGERTFTVDAPGCPGDGPGTYWVPFNLTPTESPPPVQ
jgi:hypothetical protein